MDAIEKRARELLANCLDEWGHHQEAENVREGEDLESYEFELRLIGQLLRFGFETGSGREAAALTPPEGYVLVPVEPTEDMLQAGYPRNERIDDKFDRLGAWADMLAARPDHIAHDLKMVGARPEVPS